jgi:uncharacterized membrane protein YdbT with pleckstrin-like domain
MVHEKNAVPHTRTVHHETLFGLQEGERIHFETKPLKAFFWYMLIRSLAALSLLIALCLTFFIIIPYTALLIDSSFSGTFAIMATIGIAIMLAGLIIDIIFVKKRYEMRYYWITNNRVIIKEGMFGYSIISIPLERVSDVLISRAFMERIFRFGSLHVQTLAGQHSIGGRGGAEGNLQALPHPEENQALIFDLIKKRRKTEHLTI